MLYLMCAGQQESFNRAKPTLEMLSANLGHIGEAEKAAKVKALVNIVMNINTAGLAEGLSLGSALGLTMLQEVFSQPERHPACWNPTGLICKTVSMNAIFPLLMLRKILGLPVPWRNRLGEPCRWLNPHESSISGSLHAEKANLISPR
jgi:hypothetical protein